MNRSSLMIITLVLAFVVVVIAPAGAAQCVSQQVTSPNPGRSLNQLSGVAATSASDVWAVGAFRRPSVPPKTQAMIAHYDGSTWSLVPGPRPPGELTYYALDTVSAVSPASVWTAGIYQLNGSGYGPLIEHWDGATWHLVPGPASSYGAYPLAVTGVPHSSDVWVAGSQTWPFAWLWNGSTWTTFDLLPAPNARSASPSSMSAVASNDVWLTGTEWNSFNGPRGWVDHWDGSTWARVQVRVSEPYYRISSIDARTSSDIWFVGGETTSPFGYYNHLLVEHWDGTKFRQVSVPDPGVQNAELFGVSALNAGDVWVSGQGFVGGDPNKVATVMEHWDGARWTVLPSQAGSFFGVTALPSGAWSVGSADYLNRRTLIVFSHC